MCPKKKLEEKSKYDMESTEKTKVDYFIYFLMVAVVLQLCVLIYRLVVLTSG
ncbi:hypothetical protein JCM19301_1424 [Jejuia pallidilutea]|uniref:Uncharacterized protein n=2 Tax=Jejuia pallidilutea TaxID=504487 RepID=A0A090W294_9FLAO|nr:hypothetical protein [Jejuia pallidilutea]GAL66880.1 hypothetical protein JCM19301_1424 [Jejuia pallidilutea]GAL70333.1 hypothetical protein JCM19302_3455 [Jejuia pallidilutea]GAL90417.1 hypothetical protein JCM19538_182 [Jejuia pallidilutea]